MSLIKKGITFLKYKDKMILMEAYLLLAWARYKKTTQFSKMAPALGNHMHETKQELTTNQKAIAKKISSALYLMSQYAFWESECLVKAIAGMKMLERRGIESTLYLGTAKDETGLVAHAWLRSGNYIVSGKDGNHKFTVVATFAKIV